VDVGGVLERRLDDGELDFAVIAGRSSRSTLQSQPVGAARFAWALSPSLAGASRLGIKALLEQHPLVTLPSVKLKSPRRTQRPMGRLAGRGVPSSGATPHPASA
jgi:DNA-binding transcriptional LysR family regulator